MLPTTFRRDMDSAKFCRRAYTRGCGSDLSRFLKKADARRERRNVRRQLRCV